MIALDELLSLAKKATMCSQKSYPHAISEQDLAFVSAANPETIISLINQLNEANEIIGLVNKLEDLQYINPNRVKDAYNQGVRDCVIRLKTARTYLEKYGVK